MSTFFRTDLSEDEFFSRIDFPENYFIFDLETCGFSPRKDVIVEVGWAVVRDRQIVNCDGLILDWTRSDWVEQWYLRKQLERLAQIYGEKGRQWHIPYERLAREGVDPIEGLGVMARLLHEAVEDDEWIVGHNAWGFDRRMMDGNTQRFFQKVIPWKPGSIFDTGLMEKAAQLRRPQHQGETRDEWYGRVAANRSSIQWNLDGHCVQKYKLVERFNLDTSAMHQAGFDCIFTRCLFETFRQIAEAYDG